jgi:hypothetical protein
MTTSQAKPIDLVAEAQKLYDTYAPGGSLMQDLILHLRFGIVYCDDQVLLLAKPVDRHADPSLIEDPFYIFENPNAYWINLCVGNLLPLLRLRDACDLPRFNYVGWRRRNGPPRFYPFSKLCTRVNDVLINRTLSLHFWQPGASSAVGASKTQ